MYIKSIKYSLIRKSNFNVEYDDFSEGLPSYLDNMTSLELSTINILIGQNGSGKSSIIDIVQSLRFPKNFRTLPRDNPKPKCTPGFSVEFDDGMSLIAMFSTMPFDFNKSLKHVGFSLFRSDGSNYKIICQKDLHKFEANIEFEDFISKKVRIDEINYKYCGELDHEYDDIFLDELAKIQGHLEGILDHNSRDVNDGDFIPKNRNAFFREDGQEKGEMQIWFNDDVDMTNTVSADQLPSGWKSYADITSWMSRLPESSICLIEEPEVHLHPNLQRLLIERMIELSEEKKLQLLISTHSSVFLNFNWGSDSTLIRAKRGEFQSLVNAAEVIDDLGYKPSDILQANCLIWVEGPSDRIYINHWIRMKDPALIEGVHYSIMFYGGRLYTHLSAMENRKIRDFNYELIQLSKINRHLVVVLDSDKSCAKDPIVRSKKDLIDNVSGNGGLSWVTDGREIENYLNYEELQKSILNVHPSAVTVQGGDKWSKLLNYANRNSGKSRSAKKVDVAKDYVKKNINDFDNYDLDTKVSDLVNYIYKANQI